MKQIKTICAACGTIIKDGDLIDGRFVSHGSCRICARYTLNQMEIYFLFKRGPNDEEKREAEISRRGTS